MALALQSVSSTTPEPVVVTRTLRVEVDGVLTDPTGITFTTRSPSGVETPVTPTKTGVGLYTASFTPDAAGIWQFRWVTTGTGAGSESGSVVVRDSWGSFVPLDEVKRALNKTTSSDDDELDAVLDEALADYARYVRPLPGTYTRKVHGGLSPVVLPYGTTTATAVYSDGTAVSGLELDPETALLYGTTNHGMRNVTVTYTVGGIPANHRRAIVDDVAEYWRRTQRSGSPSALPGVEDVEPGRPLVSFPRIRALAVGVVA